MYQKYLELIKKQGIRTADVCRATGISASTFTDWKNGKSNPKIDKIQKIAAFFNVSVEFFLESEEEE